jgi:AcrR family transcriptional regulator
MPRAGLGTTRVIDEAQSIADSVGVAKLTLTAVAAKLGVQVPSLYKHIASLDELQHQISLRARSDLTEQLERSAVGKSGDGAVRALATAYRRWALRHPGLYPSTLQAPVPGDAADLETSERAVQVIYSTLSGFGLTGDDAIDATRALRSALHGFVALEAAGGFGLPRDVDRSFERMVAALANTLSDWAST